MKKLSRILKINCVILFIFVVSNGCSHVQIDDHEFCGDLGPDGASCFHTLKDKSRDLNKPQWDQIRFGMLCTSAESFTNWKTAIEQLCNETKKCTYSDKEALRKFFKKVNAFEVDTLLR